MFSALAAAGLGCDNATGRADRDVLDTLASTPPAMTADQAAKNVATFSNLAKGDNVSTARKALAKAALADAELQAAQFAAADLQNQSLLISRKLWEIDQIASQTAQLSAMIQATQLSDPNKPVAQPINGQSTVVAALKADAAAARGNGDTPWAGSDAAALASVSTVRQTISVLSGKITEIKATIDGLTQKRQGLLNDASKAEQASEASQGDASEKQYIQSADLRKQAALIAVQIEQANASLVPLQQDLDTAHAHEAIVTASADAFDTQAKAYADQFDDVTKQAAQLKTQAESLINGDKASLKSKTAELNALVAAAAEVRNHAVEQYKDSVTYFNDAINASEKVKTEVAAKADAAPAETMLAKYRGDAHEAWGLRMRLADASEGLGAVDAQWAMLLSRRQKLVDSVTAAVKPLSIDVPAGLADPKLDGDLKEARTAADEAYKSADDTLDNVANVAPPKIKPSAKLLRAAVNVGWANLTAASGNAAHAKELLAAAQGYQKEVSDDAQGASVPLSLYMLTDTTPTAPAPAPK